MAELAIIIPALNESANLPACLRSLNTGVNSNLEILIVDGGSQDQTAQIAESSPGCRLLRSERAGRSRQLNLGAKASTAPILLFLHADTLVRPLSLKALLNTVKADETIVGGAFTRRFDSPSTFLKLTCLLADWRSRRFGLFLGDQGMFVRRDTFDELGGFDENLRQCEDLDFSRRLKRTGRIATLSPPVISSARRFDQMGPIRRTIRDFFIAWRFLRQNH